MKFFTKKRIWLALILFVLAIAVYFGYANREYVQQLPIGCGAKAELLCSGIYGCGRDYARFGLLYLQDGVWQGERILPEGWVAYTTTPSRTSKAGDYGAQFWLNKGDLNDPTKRPYAKLPQDMFMAEGYQGQMVAIIPSRKLVVVRLGMSWDYGWDRTEFLEDVLSAISEL